MLCPVVLTWSAMADVTFYRFTVKIDFLILVPDPLSLLYIPGFLKTESLILLRAPGAP